MSSEVARVEKAFHREAYREYLRLGPQRNVPRLQERLLEQWGDTAPTESTLYDWKREFGWDARVRQDDELISQRALEDIRDRMAEETVKRRETRLRLSDIQVSAVLKAMVAENEEGKKVPRDLLEMHPQVLRALNDTARLAGETQRLDGGEATSRLAGPEMGLAEGQSRVAANEETIAELARFIGILPDDEPPRAEELEELPDEDGDVAYG